MRDKQIQNYPQTRVANNHKELVKMLVDRQNANYDNSIINSLYFGDEKIASVGYYKFELIKGKGNVVLNDDLLVLNKDNLLDLNSDLEFILSKKLNKKFNKTLGVANILIDASTYFE